MQEAAQHTGLQEQVLALLTNETVLTRAKLRDSLSVKNERLGEALEAGEWGVVLVCESTLVVAVDRVLKQAMKAERKEISDEDGMKAAGAPLNGKKKAA